MDGIDEKERGRMERVRRFFTLRTIMGKALLALVLCGVALLISSQLIVSDALRKLERSLVEDLERGNIAYLEDSLGEGEWHVVDGYLYKGDICMGNGTQQTANEAPYVELQEKTGTYFYVFLQADWLDPEVKARIDAEADHTSGYLRVTGSTTNAAGESIVGTYLDADTAESIDRTGEYAGVVDVEGVPIYCYYKALKNAQGVTVGCAAAGRSMQEIKSYQTHSSLRVLLMLIAVLIVIIVLMMHFLHRWYRGLRKIQEYMHRIGTGILPEEPLVVRSRDEMVYLVACVNEMTASLREKERIGAELTLARDIQAHMLPNIFPAFPEHDEFDIYATMDPAREIGGDLYDMFMLDERRLAVVVADVSGKGVPAALFMVITKTLIKNYALTGMSPAEVFTKVNRMLCESNDMGLFVTAWMGYYDTADGSLVFANAGHNPPAIRHGGEFTLLRSKPGFVLGGMDGIRYRDNSAALQPGDRLFLYTDGVTEATSAAEELYGEKRMLAYLNGHGEADARETLLGLRADMDRFVDGAEQFDDITMLMIDARALRGEDRMKEREFAADVSCLHEVIEFVESELEAYDCVPKAALQVSVAVEELFVNIASYAYSDGTGRMWLGVSVDEGMLTLRFVDNGMPFDPLAREEPDTTLPAEERGIGGLGIFMVKKSMDEMSYQYENGRNVLIIRKKIRD